MLLLRLLWRKELINLLQDHSLLNLGCKTAEEEAIIDEIEAGIKRIGDTSNKHEEQFAKFNQKLSALQQHIQFQIQHQHIRSPDPATTIQEVSIHNDR